MYPLGAQKKVGRGSSQFLVHEGVQRVAEVKGGGWCLFPQLHGLTEAATLLGCFPVYNEASRNGSGHTIWLSDQRDSFYFIFFFQSVTLVYIKYHCAKLQITHVAFKNLLHEFFQYVL